VEDGGPVFLYDAPDKIPKGYPGCGECILSIARLNNTSDKYLQLFTRDEAGGDPVVIHGQNMTKKAHNGPVDFPSTIWKNGDHWNFIAQGARFTTKNKSFTEWTRVVESDPAAPDMIGCHENGGQWWIPTPNQCVAASASASRPCPCSCCVYSSCLSRLRLRLRLLTGVQIGASFHARWQGRGRASASRHAKSARQLWRGHQLPREPKLPALCCVSAPIYLYAWHRIYIYGTHTAVHAPFGA
jgi:hypothetical protein